MKKIGYVIICAFLLHVGISGSLFAGAEESAESSMQAEQKAERKLNIHVATLNELTMVAKIEQQLAQAILDGRPYEKEHDLQKIQELSAASQTALQDAFEIKKIDINSASALEFQRLFDNDPDIAKAIIDNGPYNRVIEMLKARTADGKKGVKEQVLNELAPFLEAVPVDEETYRNERGWKNRKMNNPILSIEKTEKN